MALTIAYDVTRPHRIMPDLRIISGTIAFDSSYPTGGEAFDLSPSKFTTLNLVLLSNRLGYIFEYDYTNEKVLVYYGSNEHLHTITITGGEAGTVFIGIDSDAAAAALSKTEATARAGITGIQNAAAAAASQVANAADLSSLTGVRFIAMGTV